MAVSSYIYNGKTYTNTVDTINNPFALIKTGISWKGEINNWNDFLRIKFPDLSVSQGIGASAGTIYGLYPKENDFLTWLNVALLPVFKKFEAFVTLHDGEVAGFKNLFTKITRDKLDTTQKLMAVYAPLSKSEAVNNPTLYTKLISDKAKIQPTNKLDYTNRQQMVNLMAAIWAIETGKPKNVDTNSLVVAYNQAFKEYFKNVDLPSQGKNNDNSDKDSDNKELLKDIGKGVAVAIIVFLIVSIIQSFVK